MSVEWFFKLKEYDSLSKMRINHLKALGEQEHRLSTLNERRQNTLAQIETLQHEANALQQSLFEIEKKMTESDQQKKRLIETGADEVKIQSFILRIQEGEVDFFRLMGRQEEIDQEKLDLKTFLTGIDATINEISQEVDVEKAKEKLAVSQLDLRLSLLLEELPSDFKLLLQKTLAKNLAIGPFTRVDSGACFFCRSKLSKLEESEIDMQHLLKICKMCQRIFLPYGS